MWKWKYFRLRGVVQLALLFAAGQAAAQNPDCQISPIAGASSPGGVVATMNVVNDGKPCGIALYGVPAERRNPASQGVITAPPSHGKAEFAGPRILYTPLAGYAGDDDFSFEARAIGTGTQSVLLKVRIKVLVRAR